MHLRKCHPLPYNSYTYAKRPRYSKCGLNVKRNCKNAIGPVAQNFHLPNHVMLFEVFNGAYRSFSHDVTSAILVFQNNKTAVMLVSQTNRVGVQLFSYVNTLLSREWKRTILGIQLKRKTFLNDSKQREMTSLRSCGCTQCVSVVQILFSFPLFFSLPSFVHSFRLIFSLQACGIKWIMWGSG